MKIPLINTMPFRRAQEAVSTIIVAAFIALVGCSKPQVEPFDAFLDELDVEASLDSAEEILLGTYDIASALPAPQHSLKNKDDDDDEPLWVQVKFELYAIVAPKDKKAVVAACERHRGMLDDTIVTICREASKADLDDSRWATLKSRLIDAIRPILGDDRIRQLSFSDFSWQPI